MTVEIWIFLIKNYIFQKFLTLCFHQTQTVCDWMSFWWNTSSLKIWVCKPFFSKNPSTTTRGITTPNIVFREVFNWFMKISHFDIIHVIYDLSHFWYFWGFSCDLSHFRIFDDLWILGWFITFLSLCCDFRMIHHIFGFLWFITFLSLFLDFCVVYHIFVLFLGYSVDSSHFWFFVIYHIFIIFIDFGWFMTRYRQRSDDGSTCYVQIGASSSEPIKSLRY